MVASFEARNRYYEASQPGLVEGVICWLVTDLRLSEHYPYLLIGENVYEYVSSLNVDA